MHPRPTLHDGDLVLRPLGPADAAAVHASLDDPESMRLTGTARTFTLAEVEAFYARVPDDPTRLDLGLLEATAPKRLLGELVLNEIDADARRAHFRIAIWRPQDRDRGLGTRAMRLLFAHAFDELSLERIDLEVYAFNPRAIHTYEALGFERTGVDPGALAWEGEAVDLIRMSRHHPTPGT